MSARELRFGRKVAVLAIRCDNFRMGLIRAKIRLSNPKDVRLNPIEADASVDTGALHLCIPQHIAVQLQLTEIYKREVTTADGNRRLCPYVGPVQVTFANRGCFVGALVLGDDVLLGAVPMEDMDLVISPASLKLEVNPNSPNIAASVAK